MTGTLCCSTYNMQYPVPVLKMQHTHPAQQCTLACCIHYQTVFSLTSTCWQVLCQVTVQGKGYVHPDGRVAVSCLRLDGLLEYLPKGPAEKVVSLDYCSPIGADSSSGGAHVAPYSSVRGTSRVQPPAVQLVASLQQAAWEVEA